MVPRLAQPADIPALDRLVGSNRYSSHETLLDRDTVIVAGPLGAPVGLLVARPSFFIHEVVVAPSLGMLKTASSLVRYGVAFGSARTWPIAHAIFRVRLDNEPMLRFHRALGSVDEEGKMLSYTFPKP